MKKIAISFVLIVACLLSACHNEINEETNPQKNKIGRGELAKGLSLDIKINGFSGAENVVNGTRATSEQQSQFVGDMEVVTNVVGDNTNALKTRAGETTETIDPTETFTIAAFDPSTKKVVAEAQGNFVGGKFSLKNAALDNNFNNLDENTEYIFACFNSGVTLDDSLSVAVQNAKKARIGFTKLTRNTTESQTLPFTLNPVAARVRFSVYCQKPVYTDLLVKALAIDKIPTETSILLDNTKKTKTLGAFTSDSKTLTKIHEASKQNDKQFPWNFSRSGTDYSVSNTADDDNCVYLLPQTTLNDLKIRFVGGKPFWTSYSETTSGEMNVMQTAATTQTLETGKAYSVQVRIKPRYTFLFEDGTTGFASQRGSKKAIAIVVDKEKRLAMALQDATPKNGDKVIFTNGSTNEVRNKVNTSNGLVLNTNDMQWHVGSANSSEIEPTGKEYTYNADTDTKGEVKATATTSDGKPLFPPYYYCAQYESGIYGKGQWFLPSESEWLYMAKHLMFGNGFSGNEYGTFIALLDQAIAEVGGVSLAEIVSGQSSRYWQSTEESATRQCTVAVNNHISFMWSGVFQYGKQGIGVYGKGTQWCVRAFIYY